MQRIYLVPGFFGFTNLAGLQYFKHVRGLLHETLPADQWAVHGVRTRPTGSIKQRARALLDAIHATSAPDDAIYLVGHSTGGLDARLLVTPGVQLGGDLDVESVAARVRSVVTVSTPHRGAPIAAVFNSSQGGRLLQLLSLASVAAVRGTRLPVSTLALLVSLLRDRDATGWQPLGDLQRELFPALDDEPRQAVDTFLREIVTDRALLTQLTPDAMDLFGAATPDRPDIAYGSVATVGRPPGLGTFVGAGISPWTQAAHAVYATSHRLAGGVPDPGLAPEVRQTLDRAKGSPVDPEDSDGVVPTLSQVHGRFLTATLADHLDVIGHFDQTELDPPHHDWFPSGSRFRRPEFERVWACIVGFLLAAHVGDG